MADIRIYSDIKVGMPSTALYLPREWILKQFGTNSKIGATVLGCGSKLSYPQELRVCMESHQDLVSPYLYVPKLGELIVRLHESLIFSPENTLA